MDAVSQVLAGRSRTDDSLGSVLGVSALAHVALLAIVAIFPSGWLGTVAPEPEVVMQISLDGPPGPRNGGLEALSARPVQQVQPVEATKTIEPVRPPAAAAPEMVEPTKVAPPKKQDAPTKTPSKTPSSRTPTKGAELQKGTAVAETAARGQGFGLSTGGGGNGVQLDVSNFCCPEYIAAMVDVINRNWSKNQGAEGTALMKFTIQRDGRLTAIEVERSSGAQALDYFAQRALTIVARLQPLPDAFTQPTLTVHMMFEYSR